MGAADYDYKINQVRNSITQCQSQISTLEEQIRDLQGFSEAMADYKSNLKKASEDICSYFGDPANFMKNFVRLVRLSFFQTISDAAVGPEYDTAVSHAESARQAADNKREQLRQKVEALKAQISSYNSRISTLQQQKAAYLREEKRKAEEKAAAEKTAAADQ